MKPFFSKTCKILPSWMPSKFARPLGSKFKNLAWNWHGALLVTSGVAGLTIAIRLFGWLQPLEWAALDMNFRLRPPEPIDNRILIVSVEESDITSLKQWPISDAVLAKLLTQIKQQKPKVIGLDLYRNFSVNPGRSKLVEVFETTPNLIGIQKAIGDKFNSAIAPPPTLARLKQVSANDVVVDADGVVRRGILFPMAEGNEALPSLGLAVANAYLKDRGIVPKTASNGLMKLGTTVFTPFEANDGGYVRADAGGYQILLNYRGPAKSFSSVSVTDVLENRLSPNLMRDRIVLIGTKATSLNDVFYTPYSGGFTTTPVRTSGVELQANLTSQILSSVLQHRPLITVWPSLFENLWIVLWAGIIAGCGWKWRGNKNNLFLVKVTVVVFVSGVSLISICYLSFLAGWWIPVVPPLVAIFGSTVAIALYVYVNKLQELNTMLEQTVQNLEHVLQDLQQSQIQLVQSEKMSTLGQLVAGVAHEINNPIGFVSGNLNYIKEYVRDLTNHLGLYQQQFPDPGSEIEEDREDIDLEYLLEDLPKVVLSMQTGIDRIKDISTSLRTFSRSDTSKKVVCDIHEGIDSTLMILKHRLKANSDRPEIQVIKEYGNLPSVSCYPGQLNQVIMNLIANAIDALDESNQGRSFAEINAAPNTIIIRTKLLGNAMVAIAVKDNGVGMTAEVKQRVFDHLFTTKPVGQGTGLGLSISRQIIEETHKGKFSCISAPGEGAEFIVEIPIASE